MARKKQEQKPPVNFVWITYTTREWGGDICEGQENDACPSREDSYNEHTLISLHRKKPAITFTPNTEEIVLEDKLVLDCSHAWVVYALYSDGDTFSNSNGNIAFIGAFKTSEEAAKAMQEVKDGTRGVASAWSNGYKPWDGYFSSLQDVMVQPMVLMD